MSASSAATEREELQRQYAAMKARRSASQSRGQSPSRGGSVSPQRISPAAVSQQRAASTWNSVCCRRATILTEITLAGTSGPKDQLFAAASGCCEAHLSCTGNCLPTATATHMLTPWNLFVADGAARSHRQGSETRSKHCILTSIHPSIWSHATDCYSSGWRITARRGLVKCLINSIWTTEVTRSIWHESNPGLHLTPVSHSCPGWIGKEELMLLGQTRRKAGQRGGEWTEEKNNRLVRCLPSGPC